MIQQRRKDMLSMSSQLQNRILQKSGVLNGLRRDLDDIQTALKATIEVAEQQDDQKRDLAREYSQMTDAIKNINSRCNSHTHGQQHSNKATLSEVDHNSDKLVLLQQLNFIRHKILDLDEIRNEFNQYKLTHKLITK